MCGINASRGQGHGCRFTMCHASLKMALLLHKEGLVKTTVPITVYSGADIITYPTKELLSKMPIFKRARAWLQIYDVPRLSENDTFTTYRGSC